MEKYSPSDNYCDDAVRFQSVLNADETKQKLIDNNKSHNFDDIQDARLNTLYSCPDNYQMGGVQDNQIYIATTDGQHDQIVVHQTNPHQKIDAQGGLSGYFSDQATVDACKDGNNLDNTKYNEATQIAPYRQNGIDGEGDASYKPHVDCFEINRDKLYENYGTYDFNAAIAKCEANNQFGSGGGNQGYNPYINEMIENGSLNYKEAKSFSDASISKSRHNNPNELINSVVREEKADKIYDNARIRSSDCVKNNTPHPSSEACNNGFPKENAIKIESETGNATPINKGNSSTTTNSSNVSSTTGGGSHAPPVTATDTERYPIKNDGNNGKVTTNNADGFYNAKVSPTNNSSDVTQGINKPNTGFNM